MKIIHLMIIDKFIPPFIDFLRKNFEISEHRFLFLHPSQYKFEMTIDKYVLYLDKEYKWLKFLKYMYAADKIIIHGLWSERLIKLLFLQQFLLKKCFWVMWGGDFYFPEKQTWLKKQVIKEMGNLISYIKGDYELVKKWYGTKGKYHECFMYPSNLYKNYKVTPKKDNVINIQVGNSATETNNHFEVFEKLLKYKNNNIRIYTPLTYGDVIYAEKVVKKGKELFGEKFIPLTEFMEFEKYLDFLSKIDIAIFNNNRQQAMGNIITLLGLGKKVYLRSDTTQWQLFKEVGVKVFDIANVDLEILDKQTMENNKLKIKEYFSEERLKTQLIRLFS